MSESFAYGFNIFIGVVAGALIQYALAWLNRRRETRFAKRLLGVEIAINKKELKKLEERLGSLREDIIAGQLDENTMLMDMSGFVYRIVDPLINAGHFHNLLDSDGVEAYFRFANELNSRQANYIADDLRRAHVENRSLAYARWLIESKIPEWHGHLNLISGKI